MSTRGAQSQGFDKPHSIIKSQNTAEKKSKGSGNTRTVVVNDQQNGSQNQKAESQPQRLPTPQEDQKSNHSGVHMQDTINQRTGGSQIGQTDRSALGSKYPTSLADTMSRMSQHYDDDETDDKFVTDINFLKSKVTYKPPVGSLYTRDFIKHPIESKEFKLISDPWKTYFPVNKGQYSTTSRMDYKDWKQPPPSKNFVELWKPIKAGVPFGGRSSYKSEFLQWGNNQVGLERPVQPRTVIEEAPFFSKTTTGQDFRKPVGASKAHIVNHDLFGKKSPLAPGLPFLADTTSGNAHKPFKVNFVPAELREKPKAEQTPAYPGQFSTSYRDEFVKFEGKIKANSKKPRVGFI